MQKLLTSEDRVIALYLKCLKQELKRLNGLTYELDYDQYEILEKYAKTIIISPETFRDGQILDIIERGICARGLDFLSDQENFIDLLNFIVRRLIKDEHEKQ